MKKKILLIIGILALLVSCSKSEEWKTKAYNDFIRLPRHVQNIEDYTNNRDFFIKNTNLFTSAEKKYEKYLDEDLTVEKFVENPVYEKPVLFKESFVVDSFRTKEDTDKKQFITVVESYDTKKNIGVNILIFSDEKIDMPLDKTIEITALPCALLNDYTIRDEEDTMGIYEIQISKDSLEGAKIENVVLGVATDYKIID